MKISIRAICLMALVAAVYAAVTISQAAIGFGPIQFRVAESLNLLAFFNPIFAPAVALGVLITNIASPYGVIDMVFGTLATIIALLAIRATKKTTNNLLVASFWPTIVNAAIIPLVILIPGVGLAGLTWGAYLGIAATVALGQFVVVTLFGYTFFRFMMARNKNFIETIENLR
ncbi:MAG: QueT transporter family protein [Clostridiales bacterium]|nr:QueT transporter family protein [Clostridiales bacterium]